VEAFVSRRGPGLIGIVLAPIDQYLCAETSACWKQSNQEPVPSGIRQSASKCLGFFIGDRTIERKRDLKSFGTPRILALGNDTLKIDIGTRVIFNLDG